MIIAILAIAWYAFVLSGLATVVGFSILHDIFAVVPEITWRDGFFINLGLFLILGRR